MRLNMPAPNKVHMLDYPMLSGGLNLRDLEYRLRPNESPYMKNLWWQNGVLQSRDGQRWLDSDTARGRGYTCSADLFYGNAFFHIGAKIYYGAPTDSTITLTELVAGVPENRGTFFLYQDYLIYKNRGGFYLVKYDPDATPKFTAKNVLDEALVPTIQINTNPSSGAGDVYQPENRLTPQMSVLYSNLKAENEHAFILPYKAGDVESVNKVEIVGETIPEDKYWVTRTGDLIYVSLVVAEADAPIVPPHSINSVRITFTRVEHDSKQAIMDCKYATVAGGEKSLCILLAGSTKQPNAVFWNANDQTNMNPTYFPKETYNLVADTEDPVTGFGKQYNDLLAFKEHSVCKLKFSIDRVGERSVPLFTYESVNDRIGCDLPWSIQVVENNLVFCNTYQGVHIVRSSSAALENNIECISLKINDGAVVRYSSNAQIPSLMNSVQGKDPDLVSSWDDTTRYWLCTGDSTYVWDYEVSGPGDASWFYQTSIAAVSFFADDYGVTHHLDKEGRISRFGRYYNDYGKAIDKVYQFPVTNFGTYDVLKDVAYVLLAVRSDTNARIQIEYDTDYESRFDLTDISTWGWSIELMNLAGTIVGYYNSKPPKYATVVKRKPGCRHIRHFTMTLRNHEPNADLAIVSAQVYYTFQQKER